MSRTARRLERGGGDAPGPDPGWGCTLHAMSWLLLSPRRCRPHPANSGRRGGTGLCPVGQRAGSHGELSPEHPRGGGVNGVGSSRAASPPLPTFGADLPTASYEPTPGCLEIPRQRVGEMAGEPPAPSLACTELLLHKLLQPREVFIPDPSPLLPALTRGCRRSGDSSWLEPASFFPTLEAAGKPSPGRWAGGIPLCLAPRARNPPAPCQGSASSVGLARGW